MRWCARLALVAVCLAVGACGGGHQRGASGSGVGAGGSANPRLTGAHRCPGAPGFTCATLIVPLDHGGQAKGSLRLAVGYAGNATAPRGVLVFLTGGPG